jgi:hypothetical protein
MFNKSTLVLESVTLRKLVKLVVQVLVDLAGSSVFDEKASEYS